MESKTVFKVGMKVYDSLNYPNFVGTIEEIDENQTYSIFVSFRDSIGNIKNEMYLSKGSIVEYCSPTLSIAPYTLQGFEQKSPILTYEEAEKWFVRKNNFMCKGSIVDLYPSKEYFNAFEAYKKLIILKDYYNSGWRPNWNNNKEKKYYITRSLYSDNLEIKVCLVYKKALCFKSEELANTFLKEQKELLEQALILL